MRRARTTVAAAACAIGLLGTPLAAQDMVSCQCEIPGGRDFQWLVVNHETVPLDQFMVGTMDTDPFNYSDWLRPTGWRAVFLELEVSCHVGAETTHGDVSPGPTGQTPGAILFYTHYPDAEILPGHSATFGFNSPMGTQDVDWHTKPQGSFPAQALWDEPIGAGQEHQATMGPTHGPTSLRECPVDYAPPFRTLDAADVLEYVCRFILRDPETDTARPQGVWDTYDVIDFLETFAGGCP